MERFTNPFWIAILPAIISFLTALITLSVKQKNEIRKHILEERTEFYLEIFPEIDDIINQPYLIFNQEYIDEFISFKAHMKLIASNKTFEAYEELFHLIVEPFNFYDIYCAINYEKNEDNIDKSTYDKMDKNDLELTPDEFMEKHLPDSQSFDRCIGKLFQEMRNDLGSNLK